MLKTIYTFIRFHLSFYSAGYKKEPQNAALINSYFQNNRQITLYQTRYSLARELG